MIRVPYPEWLHRRLLERDQTGRQRSITDMFARVALNKPAQKPASSNVTAVSNSTPDDLTPSQAIDIEAIEIASGSQDNNVSAAASTPAASAIVLGDISTSHVYDDDAEARAEGVDCAVDEVDEGDGGTGNTARAQHSNEEQQSGNGTGTTTRKRKSGVGPATASRGRGKGRGNQPTLETSISGETRTLHGYIRQVHRSILDSHWHIVQVSPKLLQPLGPLQNSHNTYFMYRLQIHCIIHWHEHSLSQYYIYSLRLHQLLNRAAFDCGPSSVVNCTLRILSFLAFSTSIATLLRCSMSSRATLASRSVRL